MERGELSCELIGEDDPKLVLDELGHFFSEEFGMLGSGLVASSTDALVKLVMGPSGGCSLDGYSIVSPLLE